MTNFKVAMLQIFILGLVIKMWQYTQFEFGHFLNFLRVKVELSCTFNISFIYSVIYNIIK